MRPVELLGFFWTVPNTFLGLVLGLFTFQSPRMHGGAIVFDRAPRGLTRLLRAMHRTAMTVGFVIVAAVPVEGRLLAHERHHIRQYAQWGPFFIPVYLVLAIGFGYRRHPMERAARRAAGARASRWNGSDDQPRVSAPRCLFALSVVLGPRLRLLELLPHSSARREQLRAPDQK